MPLTQITALFRYVFLIILIVAVYRLLSFSIRQLRARIKLRTAPMPGYFLMMKPDSDFTPDVLPAQVYMRGQGSSLMYAFPLYPTTVAGRSRGVDLVFNTQNIERRAFIIYRFEGGWFIRPSSSQKIFVNSNIINSAYRLSSRDKITVGLLNLVFIDEREETQRAGLVYDEKLADLQSGHFSALTKVSKSGDEMVAMADILSRKGPVLPWLLLNIFFIACTFISYLSLPEHSIEYIKSIGVYQGIIFVLLNIYFLILPLLAKNFDRITFTAFSFLLVIGNFVQLRLALVNRSQIILAKINGDIEKYKSLLEYVTKEFTTQEIAIVIGLVLMPIVYLVASRTRLLEAVITLCFVITPVLYILTMILGKDPGGTHGARLWIHIGGMSFQLTEFAKISYLVVLAGFFKIRPVLKVQVLFGIWAAFNFFLIMLVPDLGSVMILLPTTLTVYVIMTSEYLKATMLLAGGIGISSVAYAMFGYVRRRIQGWLNLWNEVTPTNAQIVYGLQAVARGGIIGRGFGNGSPAGIPESSTDMVFSVLIEEWGIITGICIVTMYLIIWLRSVYIASDSEDGFTSGMALGTATLLFVEALVVIGGSTGLIPLTGATLPFIARGGSSLVSKIILVALLLGVSGRRKRQSFSIE